MDDPRSSSVFRWESRPVGFVGFLPLLTHHVLDGADFFWNDNSFILNPIKPGIKLIFIPIFIHFYSLNPFKTGGDASLDLESVKSLGFALFHDFHGIP